MTRKLFWTTTTLFAAIFVIEAVAFVYVSLFRTIDRDTWKFFNVFKGALGFGLCGVAGLLLARRGATARSAAVSGAMIGLSAALIYPSAIYLFAYGRIEHLVQYPYEYESMRSAGFHSAGDYLRSERGSATVLETTIGIIPIVAVWAGAQGAVLAFLGAGVGRWLRRRANTPSAVGYDSGRPEDHRHRRLPQFWRYGAKSTTYGDVGNEFRVN